MKLPRRRGELLFGLAPCLAALQAARRRVYSVVLQKGFMEGAFEKDLKWLVSENVKRYVSSHGTKLYRVDKETLEGLIGKKPSHQSCYKAIGYM
ncbi:PREDICTED: rRNA methyltransferase 1, mitochondrial-like [Amphimedon queenslandica]|uniref:Uncharacterized protein n=1 Tax=Amphimedon queenslandica TaxID=400682 RepID=A0AAN0JBT2_AMPQE|nr:PREDICTED: rRNA methyltransferase 1, mitochondrial-like [Amphimedon queenslandica]|eukprot:XP_019854158.1 PREDICTED: rRNA methyltransferase 1, mitochondrial-like [Amphimedon queenslandica]